MIVKCYVCKTPLEVAYGEDKGKDLICQDCFDKNREIFDLDECVSIDVELAYNCMNRLRKKK